MKKKRTLIGAMILATAGLVLLGARPVEAPSGLFSGLEVGQAVSIKDLGTVYEITILGDALPAGYEITEIGESYLGVRDQAGVVERRIPATSIKSLTWMRVGAGRQPNRLPDVQP